MIGKQILESVLDCNASSRVQRLVADGYIIEQLFQPRNSDVIWILFRPMED